MHLNTLLPPFTSEASISDGRALSPRRYSFWPYIFFFFFWLVPFQHLAAIGFVPKSIASVKKLSFSFVPLERSFFFLSGSWLCPVFLVCSCLLYVVCVKCSPFFSFSSWFPTVTFFCSPVMDALQIFSQCHTRSLIFPPSLISSVDFDAQFIYSKIFWLQFFDWLTIHKSCHNHHKHHNQQPIEKP